MKNIVCSTRKLQFRVLYCSYIDICKCTLEKFASLYSVALWWVGLTLPGLNIRRLFGLVLELVLPWGCNTCAHKLLKRTVATSGAR